MTPEQLFLRYAVPCGFVLQQRGEIDDQIMTDLELAAVGKKEMNRADIEKIFSRAFEWIDDVARELGKDRWDSEVIREYFLHRHNQLIEKGMGDYRHAPQTLKDLCRVERARVAEKHGNFYVVVLASGKTRMVIPPFVPDAEIGEELIIHYGYAVERVPGPR